MELNFEALENQISSLKNLVKQAKVCLINKLTRDAKKLREKKGSEAQKSQNEKKANRIIEEVMIMKKVVPDEVSKFILRTENCSLLMSKPNISMEQKVFLRFGVYKTLTSVIEEFRSKYPKWKEEIDVLLEMMKSVPKKVESVLKKSLNSSIVKTPGNNIFEVTVTPTKASKSDARIKNSGRNKFKSTGKGNKQSKNIQSLKFSKNSKKSVSRKLNSTNNTDENPESSNTLTSPKRSIESHLTSDLNSEKKVKVEAKNETLPSNNFRKRNNFKSAFSEQSLQKFQNKVTDNDSSEKILEKIGSSDLEKDLGEIEKRLKKKSVNPAGNNANPTPEESVDPFFITTEGEEYITSAPIIKEDEKPPKQSWNPSQNEFYRKGKKINPPTKQNFRYFNGNNQSKNYNQKNDSLSRNNGGKGSYFSDKFQKNKYKSNENEKRNYERVNANNRQSNSIFPSKKPNLSSVDEKLHPSWEAKKKMTSIAPFEGKKIVFND